MTGRGLRSSDSAVMANNANRQMNAGLIKNERCPPPHRGAVDLEGAGRRSSSLACDYLLIQASAKAAVAATSAGIKRCRTSGSDREQAATHTSDRRRHR